MNPNVNLLVVTNNCSLSDAENLLATNTISNEVLQHSESPQILLQVSKSLTDHQWTVALSVKLNRAHLATEWASSTFFGAFDVVFSETRIKLNSYFSTDRFEPFNFDQSSEFDFYAELNQNPKKPKHSLTILVVEDDPAASCILEAALQSMGCQVDHFDSPLAAQAALQSKRYDLILLDWQLPYADGSEFLTNADVLLKKFDVPKQPICKIPVVICTSLPFEELKIPVVNHFIFCSYWHKKMPFSLMVNTLDETMKKISNGNKVGARAV